MGDDRAKDRATTPAEGSVMDLLAEHVPLALLADLAQSEPRSEAILAAEGLPDDAWWEPDDAADETPDDAPADPDAARGPDPE